MAIWFDDSYTLDTVRAFHGGTHLDHHIGIELEALGPDFLSASMPVDERTRQPYGLLHGGASVVLAESLGSMASFLTLDPEREYCVGIDINANHIRSIRDGRVLGTARPIHLGKTTQVWEIRICDDNERLICISRLTMAILQRRDARQDPRT